MNRDNTICPSCGGGKPILISGGSYVCDCGKRGVESELLSPQPELPLTQAKLGRQKANKIIKGWNNGTDSKTDD